MAISRWSHQAVKVAVQDTFVTINRSGKTNYSEMEYKPALLIPNIIIYNLKFI